MSDDDDDDEDEEMDEAAAKEFETFIAEPGDDVRFKKKYHRIISSDFFC